MIFQKFQEYLDSNKKLKTAGKVQVVADFEGKVNSKPAKEKKPKDAGGAEQKGEMKPYKGGTDAKDPNKGKDKGGLAEKGSKELEYKPKTDAEGTKKATWPKTKTEAWLEKTRGLSLAEFTKTIRNEAVKGLDECACQETQPHNAIKNTVEVCKCNKQYLSSLVREMKRNNMFNSLFSEMIQYPEAYANLAVLMGKDESVARKLVRALNEDVGPPMGDEAMVPMKKKVKPNISDLDSSDSDMDMDSEDDSDMDSDSCDDSSDDMEGEGEGDADMGSDMTMPPKKKNGMKNLIGAMGGQAAISPKI